MSSVLKETTEVILFGKGAQKVNCSEMARRVGCGPQTIRDWRAGKYPLQLTWFARICSERGLSPTEIGELVQRFGK